MTLTPKLPPGRANRKALQFAVDIHRLRNAGYSFSAIRGALLEAGTVVSLSTVKREAARPEAPAPRALHAPAARPSLVAGVPAPATGAPPPHLPSAVSTHIDASGREIAEAFFNANPSNPLLRAKDKA